MTQPNLFLVDKYGQPSKSGGIVVADDGTLKFVTYTSTGQQVTASPGGATNYLGVFASSATLQATYPAASNVGNTAAVGSSAPYTQYVSNGVTWISASATSFLGIFASTSALQTAYPAGTNTGSTAAVGSATPYTQYVSNGVTWVISGGSTSFLGIYANSTALQTAYPASANTGSTAAVGSGAPYTQYISNGSAWVSNAAASTIAGASDYSTARLPSQVSTAIPFSATTGIATAPAPTGTFTPTSGTAPPAGFTVVTCTSNPGALPVSVDGTSSMNLNDSLVWSPALSVWVLQYGPAVLNTQTINAQSGTTYTFAAADAGQVVQFTSASAVTATIPPQSSVAWAAGTVLTGLQYGAGGVTFAAGSGVTIVKSATRTLVTAAQYEFATALRVAQDTWLVTC